MHVKISMKLFGAKFFLCVFFSGKCKKRCLSFKACFEKFVAVLFEFGPFCRTLSADAKMKTAIGAS